jgi:peptidoglycan/xylan/chitin deacetylase (PgdA/CDA1 family)
MGALDAGYGDGMMRARGWSPSPVVRASIWAHAGGVVALAAWPAAWPQVVGLLAANHALLACGMHPRGTMLGPNLVRLPPDAAAARMVALTFDDGPDPAVTPRVLDLLDRHGASASFFAIGRRAARHPELLREALRRGHDVQNHTLRHPLGFAAWTPGAMRRELEAAQSAIAAACGATPRFFRAPAGLRNPLLDPVLARTGLHLASWTRRGYDTVSRDPDAVLRRLTRGLAAGDILLLHDGSAARDARGVPVVLTVLPALLDHLAALGLRPVSLSRAMTAATSAAEAGAAPGAAAAPASPAPAAHASR